MHCKTDGKINTGEIKEGAKDDQRDLTKTSHHVFAGPEVCMDLCDSRLLNAFGRI